MTREKRAVLLDFLSCSTQCGPSSILFSSLAAPYTLIDRELILDHGLKLTFTASAAGCLLTILDSDKMREPPTVLVNNDFFVLDAARIASHGDRLS